MEHSKSHLGNGREKSKRPVTVLEPRARLEKSHIKRATSKVVCNAIPMPAFHSLVTIKNMAKRNKKENRTKTLLPACAQYGTILYRGSLHNYEIGLYTIYILLRAPRVSALTPRFHSPSRPRFPRLQHHGPRDHHLRCITTPLLLLGVFMCACVEAARTPRGIGDVYKADTAYSAVS